MKELTKICWHLFASPATSDFSGEEGLTMPLTWFLVTSFCSQKTAYWGPASCSMWWGSMGIGDPSKSHKGGSGGL